MRRETRPELIEEYAAPPPEESAEEKLSTEIAPLHSDPDWRGLLEYLLTSRGLDLHGYKPTSLARRIRKRMEALNLQGFAAYRDYLKVHPNEFGELFNTILINVTGFFRDPAAWDAVCNTAIPEILTGKSTGEPIRVWSAGCASGEEAYTIAMLLAEQLDLGEFRERVKIYATDVDEDALNTARHAAYTDRQVEAVPPELLSKYFERVDGLHLVSKDLRRQVIFGRHDLISDAPISRVDLLICRNTLMYLNGETQARVLTRLHFALNEGGFLLLGRAETLMAHCNSFLAVDLRRRLSRKGMRRSLMDQALRRGGRGSQIEVGHDERSRQTREREREWAERLRQEHEESREGDEMRRSWAEEVRAAAEELRESHEQLRRSAEETRAVAEDVPRAAEELRRSSEIALKATYDQLAIMQESRESMARYWGDLKRDERRSTSADS